MRDITESDGLFETVSVLQKNIRIMARYWGHIVKHKHPELEGRITQVLDTLKNSDEVYQQEENGDIYLYY